jgi:hypothetical protein
VPFPYHHAFDVIADQARYSLDGPGIHRRDSLLSGRGAMQ